MRITLPRMMQTHIYCHLEGKYNPDFIAAQQNLLADEEKLLTYLGTYFPRSFAEYYFITSKLLANLRLDNNNATTEGVLDVSKELFDKRAQRKSKLC